MAKKGMTLYKYEVTGMEMKVGGAEIKEIVLSTYKDADMVIKSVQSDFMKQKKVAMCAVQIESRKVDFDLDAAWNNAKK